MSLTQISAATVFYASVVALGLFALPSFLGTIKQAGIGRAIAIFVSLGALIVGFETLAVKTGLPYGGFSYIGPLGRKLFGTTPWIISLTYPPIIIGAFWLARKMSAGFLVPMFTALYSTFTYVILGPSLQKLSIWKFEQIGPVFGIQLRVFIGWFICAFISGLILKLLWGENPIKRLSAYSWFCILLFWSGVCLGVGLLMPSIIGMAASVTLFILFMNEKRREKN